jgi:hypothetical protein
VRPKFAEIERLAGMMRKLGDEMHREFRYRRAYSWTRPMTSMIAEIAERPSLAAEAFTAPRIHGAGDEDGCSSECA